MSYEILEDISAMPTSIIGCIIIIYEEDDPVKILLGVLVMSLLYLVFTI